MVTLIKREKIVEWTWWPQIGKKNEKYKRLIKETTAIFWFRVGGEGVLFEGTSKVNVTLQAATRLSYSFDVAKKNLTVAVCYS